MEPELHLSAQNHSLSLWLESKGQASRPLFPSQGEIRLNPRARSAKLRAAERV